jgi:hypothetical protein
MEPSDYFEEIDGKWHFYDETWLRHGPYDTKEECVKAFEKYCNWLDVMIEHVSGEFE